MLAFSAPRKTPRSLATREVPLCHFSALRDGRPRNKRGGC